MPSLGRLHGFLEGIVKELSMTASEEAVLFDELFPSYIGEIQSDDGWIDVRNFTSLAIAVSPTGGPGTYRLVGRRSSVDSAETEIYPSTSVSSYTEIFSGEIQKYSHIKLYHSGSNTTNAYMVGRSGRISESLGAIGDILKLYAPDILLDFNQPEGSGSTIPDISGNGRDFTADGTESETPTLTSFYWRGPVGHLANTPGRLELATGATWTIDTTWTTNHTFVWGSKVNQGGSAAYQFDIESDRMVWTGQNTPRFGMIGSVDVNTPYNAALDNEFMPAFVLNGTDGQGTMYINGLPIKRATVGALDINAGNTWTIGQRFNGSNAAIGDYDGFFLYKNAALTDADIYDIYVRASGRRHFHRERIDVPKAAIDAELDLLIDDVVHSSGVVTAWESTDESAAIDIGTLFGSPARSAEGGLELDGSSDYATLSGTTGNFQAITETGVFTLAARVRLDNIGTPQQTILQTKSNGRGIFFGTDGGTSIRFRSFDDLNNVLWNHDVDLNALGYSDGDEIDIVVYGDGTDSRISIDGVVRDTQTISTEAGAHQFAGFVGRYTSISSGFFNGAINGLIYSETTLDVATVRSRMANTLKTGLVQALPLWELDGADAMDVSGQENHGSYINGVALGDGKTPNDLFLDSPYFGSNQSVNTSTGVNILTDDFTVAAFVRPRITTTRGLWQIGADDNYLQIKFAGASLQLIASDGTFIAQSVVANPTLENWYLVVATWDASTAEFTGRIIGIDDDVDVSATLDASGETFTSTAAETEAWNDTSGNDGFYNICGACKWDRVLTGVEIKALMGEPIPGDYFELVQNTLGADNIVAHYRLDETTGTNAADASGNNNDGTYESGVTLGATSLLTQGGGASVGFDGVNDHIQLPAFDFIDTTGVFTVLVWADVPATGEHWLIGNTASGSDRGWGLLVDRRTSNELRFFLNISSTLGLQTTARSGPLAAGRYLFGITGDGTNVRIYLNGVDSGGNTFTFGTSAIRRFDERIGCYVRSNLFPLDGSVDEVTIANTTASAADILVLYNYGIGQ